MSEICDCCEQVETVQHLVTENAALREALSRHRHTNACLAYAATTGRAFCIAECADSYAAIAKAADPFREAETLEIMRQQYTAIYVLMRDTTGDTSRFPSLVDWVRSLVDEAQAQLTAKRGPQ